VYQDGGAGSRGPTSFIDYIENRVYQDGGAGSRGPTSGWPPGGLACLPSPGTSSGPGSSAPTPGTLGQNMIVSLLVLNVPVR